MIRALLALALVLAGPLAAAEERVMSPSEFREYAEGWTLHFERGGQPYGSETFLEGGRTVWRFHGGACTRGTWHAEGAQICFSYDDGSSLICWRFVETERGVTARLLRRGEPGPDLEIDVGERTRVPIACGAPSV